MTGIPGRTLPTGFMVIDVKMKPTEEARGRWVGVLGGIGFEEIRACVHALCYWYAVHSAPSVHAGGTAVYCAVGGHADIPGRDLIRRFIMNTQIHSMILMRHTHLP